MPVGVQIDFKWENLNQLLYYFERLPTEIRKNLETKLHEATVEVRDEAKRNCPVDTGSLQKSIRIQTYARPAGVIHKTGVSAGGYVINPKTGRTVDYASHVEYGTSKTPEQPFLRPAFENKKRELRQVVKEAVREAMVSLMAGRTTLY